MTLQTIFQPYTTLAAKRVIRMWVSYNIPLWFALYVWLHWGDWFAGLLFGIVLSVICFFGVIASAFFYFNASMKRKLEVIGDPEAKRLANKLYLDYKDQTCFYDLPGFIHIEYATDLAVIIALAMTGHFFLVGVKAIEISASFPLVLSLNTLKTPVEGFKPLKTEE